MGHDKFTLRSEKNTMNTKTKMMLGLSVLTAGTLAAGATGTFAWFTTNKTVTATYNKIQVVGMQGNLKAQIKGVTDSEVTTEYVTDPSITAGASYTSDVSSTDGLTFAQPDWVKEAGNSKSYNKVKNVTKESKYFTQYLISFNNVSGDHDDADASKVSVILTGVSITGDSNAVKWARVAINTNVTADTTNKILSSGTGNTTYLYQSSVTDATSKYVAPVETAGTALNLVSCTPTPVATNSITDTTVVASLEKGEANVKTIGVSVWLEGTMTGDESQDLAKGEQLNVALTFKTGDVANA